jgi:hypothetical protein
MLERCSCAGAWVWTTHNRGITLSTIRLMNEDRFPDVNWAHVCGTSAEEKLQDPTKNLATSRNSGFSSSDS